MGIVVISDESLKREFCGETEASAEIKWVATVQDVPSGTSILVDLLFENNRERVEGLKNSGADTIIVNAVADTLAEINTSFVRINGWPTFLQGAIIECSGEAAKRKDAEEFFFLFQKKAEWVADEPGFITPRVVSMIINEAFYALSENVSSKEDINTAMKLGTNYPYGPFEWAERIGIDKIHALLTRLSKSNPRYNPASSLTAKTERR